MDTEISKIDISVSQKLPYVFLGSHDKKWFDKIILEHMEHMISPTEESLFITIYYSPSNEYAADISQVYR